MRSADTTICNAIWRRTAYIYVMHFCMTENCSDNFYEYFTRFINLIRVLLWIDNFYYINLFSDYRVMYIYAYIHVIKQAGANSAFIQEMFTQKKHTIIDSRAEFTHACCKELVFNSRRDALLRKFMLLSGAILIF